MTDEAGLTHYPSRKRWLHAGCAVQIASGTLAGLSGVLVRYSRAGNCLISLDGVQEGVLAIIAVGSLQRPRSAKVAALPRSPTPFTIANN